MEIGVFIPIGSNGWLISTTSPQYKPSFALNRDTTLNAEASLLFELVIPQGAEVVGTYQADFYAGTAAVTRNVFGAGHGWYVGAGLDQAGVTWVVRRVLDRHELYGPYPDVPGLETAVRVTNDGSRLLFLLNHNAEPVEVTARAAGVELLTGERITEGQTLTVGAGGVMVTRQ